MPTVILLDVSLSMYRTIKQSSDAIFTREHNEELIETRHLANVGIGALLSYFAQNAQLEYTSLVIFSSLWEIRHQFTRHHDVIKAGIYDLELYDKSNVANALRGVLSLKLKEWSQNGIVNIILITDGHYYNAASLRNDNINDKCDEFCDIDLSELENQFDFPCKLQVVCLTSSEDPALKHSLPFYKRLVPMIDSSVSECPVFVGTGGKIFKQSAIWLADSNRVTVKSVENIFSHIAELHYKPFHTTLSCGHLSSMVMLSSKPSDYLLGPLKNEFDDLKSEETLKNNGETYVNAVNKISTYKLADDISICGFMPLAEIASPAVVSRHMVLPIPSNKFNETSKAIQILSQDPNAYSKSLQAACELEPNLIKEPTTISSGEPVKQATKTSTAANEPEQDISKQPTFCVLLHNCLKQENFFALCIVGKCYETNEDWFGMLHTHIDSKKRHSLMLSLFIPGSNPIPWLPNFKSLGSAALISDLTPTIRENLNTCRGPSKSYSSNNVVWLDPESVRADVQKVVRHAKRGPEKAPHFFKELNRIRRAAISYGFFDVLYGLASILEREKNLLLLDSSKPVHPDTVIQIDHVVQSLRAELTEENYDKNILPIIEIPS